MFSPCCFLIRLSLFHDKWVSHQYPVTDQSSHVFPINALAQLGAAFNRVPFFIPLGIAITEQSEPGKVRVTETSAAPQGQQQRHKVLLVEFLLHLCYIQPEKNSRRESSTQSPHLFGHVFPSTAWLLPRGMETWFWEVTSNAAAPT